MRIAVHVVLIGSVVAICSSSAQEIEAKLGGNSGAYSFTVKNNSLVPLFSVFGNGPVWMTSLGINTNTPDAALHVVGQVKITGGAPGAGKVLTSDASGLAAWATPTGGGSLNDAYNFGGAGGGRTVAAASGPVVINAGTGHALDAVTSSGTAAMLGTNSSTASDVAGVKGEVLSTTPGGFSAGVLGVNNGTSTLGIGVYGLQNGDGWGVAGMVSGNYGIGVYGYNTGTLSEGALGAGPIGVRGSTTVATSPAVRGNNPSTMSTGSLGEGAYGVHGVSSATSGVGVFGTQTGASPNSHGVAGHVTGTSPSSSSAGVYGKNFGTGSDGYGVWGQHAGEGVGVYGLCAGPGGAALFGQNLGSGSLGSLAYQGHGVYGVATGSTANGCGVLGEINLPSPAAYSAAVRGRNNGTGATGIGVWGSQGGSGWGVYGTCSISGGAGVYGLCSSSGYNAQLGGGTFGLSVSGPAICSAGVWTSSDIRFKKEIATLENALPQLTRLRGVSYVLKKDEFPTRGFPAERQLGFIAQEVEVVYPELVSSDQDGYKTVDYARLTPILVEAIKEQQALIDAMETTIASLRSDEAKQGAQIESLVRQIEELRQLVTRPAKTKASLHAQAR